MRVNVYLPDDLHETVKAELPGLNVSAALQTALRRLLDCGHRHLRCTACEAEVDAAALAEDAVGDFYADLLFELQALVDAGGTAEGAGRVAKRLALERDVQRAERLPLPRPVRAAATRAEHNATRLPMAFHPSRQVG